MFRNMPRQTFGKVQSKLFPQYFALTTGATLVLVAGAVAASAPPTTLATLGLAAAFNVLNWLAIEPIATRESGWHPGSGWRGQALGPHPCAWCACPSIMHAWLQH
jgi:hypothetical protein